MSSEAKIRTIKGVFIGIGGMLSSVLGILYVPVMLLVTCNILDYITGLIAATYRSEDGITSYKSIRGIFKKVSMWMLIVVGAVLDELLVYATNTFGWEIQVNFLIAAITAVWLVLNELISIIENLKDSKVPIPKFLLPLVKNIKKKTEDMVPEQKVEDE